MRYEPIDVSVEELEHLVEQAGVGALPPEGQRKLKAALDTLGTLAELLAERDTTIGQLRALLLGPRKTEKTRKLSWLRILLRKVFVCTLLATKLPKSQSRQRSSAGMESSLDTRTPARDGSWLATAFRSVLICRCAPLQHAFAPLEPSGRCLSPLCSEKPVSSRFYPRRNGPSCG